MKELPPKLLAILSMMLPLAADAQVEGDSERHGCQIEWVYPGHFEDAIEQARESNRMLIIKGLGFGLDETGATCATKGDW